MIKLIAPFMLLILACNSQQHQNAEITNTAKSDTARLATTPGTAQKNDTTVAEEKPAGPVAAIRVKVEAINKAQLKQRHFEFMCDEKMKVDYFYNNNNEVLKIHVDYGTIGDVYAREDYYYDNGKLIFNYEFVEGGPACEGCIKKNEHRSYISNNTVIKYLKDQKAAECRKCEFGSLSKQYKLLKANSQEQVKAVLCK